MNFFVVNQSFFTFFCGYHSINQSINQSNHELFVIKQSFFTIFVDITALLSASFAINSHISTIFLHW
jgi:hypothetical protein